MTPGANLITALPPASEIMRRLTQVVRRIPSSLTAELATRPEVAERLPLDLLRPAHRVS
jgi:hypothetical protein